MELHAAPVPTLFHPSPHPHPAFALPTEPRRRYSPEHIKTSKDLESEKSKNWLWGHWLGYQTPQPIGYEGVECECRIWKYKFERHFRFQSPGRNVTTISAHFDYRLIQTKRFCTKNSKKPNSFWGSTNLHITILKGALQLAHMFKSWNLQCMK